MDYDYHDKLESWIVLYYIVKAERFIFAFIIS